MSLLNLFIKSNNKEWFNLIKQRITSDNVYLEVACQIIGSWPLSWYQLRYSDFPESGDILKKLYPNPSRSTQHIFLLGEFIRSVDENKPFESLSGEICPFIIGIYDLYRATDEFENVLTNMYQTCKGAGKVIPSLLLALNEAGPQNVRLKLDAKKCIKYLVGASKFLNKFAGKYQKENELIRESNRCILCGKITSVEKSLKETWVSVVKNGHIGNVPGADQQPSFPWINRAYKFLFEAYFRKPLLINIERSTLKFCPKCAEYVCIQAEALRREQYVSLTSLLSDPNTGRIVYSEEKSWESPNWLFQEPWWITDEWLLKSVLLSLNYTTVEASGDLRPQLFEEGSLLSRITNNKMLKWSLNESVEYIQEFTKGTWQQLSKRYAITKNDIYGCEAPEVLNWVSLPVTIDSKKEQQIIKHHLSFQWVCAKKNKYLLSFKLIIHRIRKETFCASILQSKLWFNEEASNQSDILRDLPPR
jgi:hypothetical protein